MEGEAHSIVTGCDDDNATTALKQAVAQLKGLYADPYKYAESIFEKIKSYP